MGAQRSWGKRFRNATMAALLVGASISLTGCWGTLYDNPDGTRVIVINRKTTDQMIWDCTAKKGTGSDRAFCVLGDVGALCFAYPIKGVSDNECYTAENKPWDEMDQAIKMVLGNYDCLVFKEDYGEINLPPFRYTEWTANQVGNGGCAG